MSWTLDTAVTHIRELLQDNDNEGYRSSTEKIIRILNIALVDTRKLRPDLFLPDIANYVPVYYTEASLGLDPATPIPIDPMYFSPVIDYVVGYISLEDDEFAVDGRATALLNRFSQKLIGKGA
jgi:hypothetical protein